MGMKLTKEFVISCRKVGVLRDFLCQAIDQVDEKDKEIAELEEERRWRKFPDEKPKEDTWCIVFHDGEIDSDHYTRFAYNKKCDFTLYGNKVTHWKPLPSAPKEGE